MCKKWPKTGLPELQFNVAQLLKAATGTSRSYSVHITNLYQLEAEARTVSPLTGQVRLLRTGPEILVVGTLETTLEKTCGRCLTRYTVPITVELEEEFQPTVNILTGAILPKSPEGDEATYIDEHHILDLSEVVRQELLLISDGLYYCHPNCKGLCPYCGQDLNTGSCDCQDNFIDARWADLLSFQVED